MLLIRGLVNVFQTSIGTEQLISYMWTAVVDTLTLQNSDGEIIPVLEVHDFLRFISL